MVEIAFLAAVVVVAFLSFVMFKLVHSVLKTLLSLFGLASALSIILGVFVVADALSFRSDVEAGKVLVVLKVGGKAVFAYTPGPETDNYTADAPALALYSSMLEAGD